MIAVYGAVALTTDSPACLVSFCKKKCNEDLDNIRTDKKFFGKKVNEKYDH